MLYLIIVGIIVVIVGVSAKKANSPARPYGNLIMIIGFVIVILSAIMASVVQINPGEIGVQKLFGKVNNNTLESGLNVVNPLVEVVNFDIRTQNYTMSGVQDEGDKSGDDAIRVLSADGLEVVID